MSKIIKLTEKDFKDGVYCGKKDVTNVEGNLEIVATGWLRFKSGISAKGDISAEGGISAEDGISAGGGISAEGGILKATYGITAGLKIYAKTTIESGMRIFAGIAPWSWVKKEHREIKCGKLLSGEIVYGDLVETEVPEEKHDEIIELNGENVVKYK